MTKEIVVGVAFLIGSIVSGVLGGYYFLWAVGLLFLGAKL
ncbi:hypothetical protein LCGC14_1121510 [marine sediment metagenome]|uniref:Uncharacterized protein n=1 Tax=marine sediment metagenome TaxID=412755 RepID=A0A0F9MRL7_9ZZZZ